MTIYSHGIIASFRSLKVRDVRCTTDCESRRFAAPNPLEGRVIPPYHPTCLRDLPDVALPIPTTEGTHHTVNWFGDKVPFRVCYIGMSNKDNPELLARRCRDRQDP